MYTDGYYDQLGGEKNVVFGNGYVYGPFVKSG